jgi:hypothetical protein
MVRKTIIFGFTTVIFFLGFFAGAAMTKTQAAENDPPPVLVLDKDGSRLHTWETVLCVEMRDMLTSYLKIIKADKVSIRVNIPAKENLCDTE